MSNKTCQDWHSVALFALIQINPVAEMTPLTPRDTDHVSHTTALSSSPSHAFMEELILQTLTGEKKYWIFICSNGNESYTGAEITGTILKWFPGHCYVDAKVFLIMFRAFLPHLLGHYEVLGPVA